MSDINNTIISGRLVRNRKLCGNGTKVALFTLAVNRRYLDKSNNWQQETAFVGCKCFGVLAESVAKHTKGDPLGCGGRLRTEKWEPDGTMRTELVLLANTIQFLSNPCRADLLPPANNDGENNSRTHPTDTEDAPPF